MIGIWRNLTKVSSVQVTTLFGMLLLAGCGDGVDTKPTAKVTGKVTYDGKPVTGGSLMFSPISAASNNQAGKAGDATIKSDGTFTVTTYSPGDGAVVGQHRIAFMPPAPATAAASPDGAHTAAPPAAFDGLVPKTTEVTVAKGDNKIEVELVKQGPPK
jgi:hypothetical protein